MLRAMLGHSSMFDCQPYGVATSRGASKLQSLGQFLARHHVVCLLRLAPIIFFTIFSSKHSPTRDHRPILYDHTTSARVRGRLQSTVLNFTITTSMCSNGGRRKRNIYGSITKTPSNNVKYAKFHNPNNGYSHRTCIVARVRRGGQGVFYGIIVSHTTQG